MVYSDDNIHEILEKVAAKLTRTELGLIEKYIASKGVQRVKPGYAKGTLGDRFGSVSQQFRGSSNAGRRKAKTGDWQALGTKTKVAADDNIHDWIEKTAKLKLPGPLSKYFKQAPKSPGYQRSRQAAIERGSKNVPGYTPRARRTFEAFGLNTTSGRRPVAAGAGFKKTAAHQAGHKKRDIRSALMAGAGAYGGISAAEAIAKRRLKLPGAMAVALPSAFAASEAYKSLRSGARRREIRRRGAEAQEYMKQVRRAKRASGATKTANIQMIKMFLRQGMDVESAVKRAYPHWTKARRTALVARLRG